ncbi:hypothetical protein QBC40DRAFT_305991 [Triangularia verruculosa]|uniref:Uncharacterized protein n=1 Tax=Triangularia verruculosa TaxID=2587418 RepID=A0AAN6XIC7_9PEZI|nr:hypothetical protein QBC40DRAFT_305991 [Triangularia verruculosa]
MQRGNRPPRGRPGPSTQDAPVLLQDLAPRASTSNTGGHDTVNDQRRQEAISQTTAANSGLSPAAPPGDTHVMNDTQNAPSTPAQHTVNSSSQLANLSTAETVENSPTSTAPQQHISNISTVAAVPSNNPTLSSRIKKIVSRISLPPASPVIKRLRRHLKVPTILLITLLLFIFVTLISWQAHNLDWPLARIPIPSGILLLTVVAKFTDWALAGVTDDAWERLQWGPLLRGKGNLLTFLVMSSGFGAWCTVLFASRVQPGEETTLTRIRRLAKQKWKWKITFSARFWSFARIFFWLFVQFPGLILMAMIENKDSFRPSGWVDVTGGLGVFNISLGWLQPADPVQYRHVFSILQDPAMTVLTEPISERCGQEKTCESYLFSGGLELLQPWPNAPRQMTIEHAYMVRNMPSYQIDAWETSFNTSLPYGEWDEEQCRVFAIGSDRYGASDALQVCANRDGEEGRLLAGIRACGFQALDESGNCTLEVKYPGWNSFPAFTSTLEFYRVTADLAFDRHTRSILELSDKQFHVQHNVDPEDFLNAFDFLLCPFIKPNTTQTSRWCINGGVNYMLTNAIYIRLIHAYSEVAFDNVDAVNILRNLFATALYLFNPVYWRTIMDGSTPIRPNETTSGLPAENTFRGSPAIQASYVAPATWTVVAFIVSAVFLITAAVFAMVVSAAFAEMPDLNKFPVLDGTKVVVVDPTTGGETFFGNEICQKKTSEEVIYAARQTTVHLTQREDRSEIALV